MSVKIRKKLIEVALPLEAINAASASEKAIRQGHPSSLHLWWARRPLAAARAVIFSQMVDDPSSWPDRFSTEEAQDVERQRLFRIIEQLVLWENTANEDVLDEARAEIRRSWRDACDDNKDHPRTEELFDPDRLPGFHDPFCGGGALPLEAQRLGLDAWASDLNPVAVMITKALIEIPPKFVGRAPVGPVPYGQGEAIPGARWTGAAGLAEDIRRYGAWVRAEAEKKIGGHYPRMQVTDEIASARPDLIAYVGQELPVIAWLWARTVRSPNPGFANVEVPLVATFMISTKAGKEAYVEPVILDGGYEFIVKAGKPDDATAAAGGTKHGRGANFKCVMSGVPITGEYIKAEAEAGRMGARLMAIVAEGNRSRVYLSPTAEHEAAASGVALADWKPDIEFFRQALGFRVGNYGMRMWSDLFTDRQLLALATLSELVAEVREQVLHDAIAADIPDDGLGLAAGGSGAAAYADAIAVYLAFALDKQADLGNSLCRWEPIAQCPRQLFGRQAIPMVWDFAEGNPLGDSSGAWVVFVDGIAKAFARAFARASERDLGHALQLDACDQSESTARVVSTDPPYYDNVGYADLSDFFYTWLRRTLQPIYPDIFSTVTTPKAQELVATPARHGGADNAERFFLEGMTRAIGRLAQQAHASFPVTIYYAFKQSETQGDGGVSSTGWETFLAAVVRAGFAIDGTWPVRTENSSRMRGMDSNALASSVVLVCRPRNETAKIATRGEFLAALKAELPSALRHLQRGNIAPVDLAQSAVGPGMAIYTRYAKVLNADGSQLSVRDALGLINQTLDEVLAEQEGEFDADTRWAVAWFEQFGFTAGNYGVAESLSKAKNTSVDGMVDAGIIEAGRGHVRLLRPDELPIDWDPLRDARLTVWESTHHLVRALDQGELAAANLASQLGGLADLARDLAYRLYVLCERKKRAQEALAYNGLVQSWPEIVRLATAATGVPEQATLEV